MPLSFRDGVDQIKEQMRRNIPRDAWQNDVWEHLRTGQASTFRMQLLRLLDDHKGKAVADSLAQRIRPDLFPVRTSYRAPDNPDAKIVELLPEHLVGDEDDIDGSLEIATAHSSYKLTKWETTKEFTALSEALQSAQDWQIERYQTRIQYLALSVCHQLGLLECDQDTKSNFRFNPVKVRLIRDLSAIGENIWGLLSAEQTGGEE